MLIERILLGAIALHLSRLLVMAINGLRLVVPEYWPYGAIALFLTVCFVITTRLPSGCLERLRYHHRYQVVGVSAVVGLILGMGGM